MNYGGPVPKLSGWEISEVVSRARAIQERHRHHVVVGRGNGGGFRTECGGDTIRNLAHEYGITERTLYRYLDREDAA